MEQASRPPQDDQELYEFSTHAFVIKIWLEDGLRWRGHITHVPSGERSYFEVLGEIDEFIIPYLEKMGIQRSSIEQLNRRWKSRLSRRKAEVSHEDNASHPEQGENRGEKA